MLGAHVDVLAITSVGGTDVAVEACMACHVVLLGWSPVARGSVGLVPKISAVTPAQSAPSKTPSAEKSSRWCWKTAANGIAWP